MTVVGVRADDQVDVAGVVVTAGDDRRDPCRCRGSPPSMMSLVVRNIERVDAVLALARATRGEDLQSLTGLNPLRSPRHNNPRQ